MKAEDRRPELVTERIVAERDELRLLRDETAVLLRAHRSWVDEPLAPEETTEGGW